MPKADEGGERSTSGVLSRKADRQVWFSPVMQASPRRETPPHPASPPSPPQKAWGRRRSIEKRSEHNSRLREMRVILRKDLNEVSSLARISHTIEEFGAPLHRAPSPPGLLRGEKVPKADEGGERSTSDALSRKADRQVWFSPRHASLPAPGNTPSSGFATFSPTKSVGEKALIENVVCTTPDCEKCGLV